MAVIPLTQLKVTSPLIFLSTPKHTHTPSPPPTPSSHFYLLIVLFLYPLLGNTNSPAPSACHDSAVLKLISSFYPSFLPFPIFNVSPHLPFLHRCGFSSCKAGGADCWSEQHQEARRLPGEVQLQWNRLAQVKSEYSNHFIYTYCTYHSLFFYLLGIHWSILARIKPSLTVS